MTERDVYRCGRHLNRLRWATHLRLLCGHEWQPSPFEFFDAIEELLVSIAETSKLSVQSDRLQLLRAELHDMLLSPGNDEAQADWRNELGVGESVQAAAIEANLFFSAAEGFVERIEQVIVDAVNEHQMARCESLLRLGRLVDQLVRPRRLFGQLALTRNPECVTNLHSWLTATMGLDGIAEGFFWDSLHAVWFGELRRRVSDCGLSLADDWWRHFVNECRSSRTNCRREIFSFGRLLRDRLELVRPRCPDSVPATATQPHVRGRRVRADDIRVYIQMIHDWRTGNYRYLAQLAARYNCEADTARRRIERFERWYDEAGGDVEVAVRLCCRQLAQEGRLAGNQRQARSSRA